MKNIIAIWAIKDTFFFQEEKVTMIRSRAVKSKKERYGVKQKVQGEMLLVENIDPQACSNIMSRKSVARKYAARLSVGFFHPSRPGQRNKLTMKPTMEK